MSQMKTNPLQQVKEKLDFMEVIREHVNLEPSGDRYLGFCPFHENVNTPSFTVYPDQERWICYGCDEKGDVLRFLENIEGVSLREILKKYAKEFGIPLYRLTREAKKHIEEMEILHELVDEAAQLYHETLVWLPLGSEARKYIADRGILPDTIERFNLGYALNSWKATHVALMKKGYFKEQLIAAGIVKKGSNDKIYDFFRKRLIFPIAYDSSPIAFAGRTLLTGSEAPVKYLNSPSTDLFKKGKILYGLPHAREGIKREGSVIVVEGYMDVIALHQNGFDNAVSIMGTSFSKHHIKTLARLTDRVILVLDSDDAGRKAIMRIKMEGETGIDLYVVELPDKDPDEIVLENKDEWSNLLDSAKAIPIYITDTLVAQSKDLTDPKEKKRIVNRVTYLLNFVTDPHEQAAYLEYLSRAVGYEEYIVNPKCPHCRRKYHD